MSIDSSKIGPPCAPLHGQQTVECGRLQYVPGADSSVIAQPDDLNSLSQLSRPAPNRNEMTFNLILKARREDGADENQRTS